MSVIEISNLTKYFKDVKAVDCLSFKVDKGALFAFLGVNGAGKSTTINIMCGQLSKDEGKVIIDGVDIDKDSASVKNKIGVVFQNSVLDKSLSVRDNLQSRASLYGIVGENFENKLKELSSILDLGNLLKRKVGKLSGGQRRRIDIARALLHDPKILILDEPTTGLDPYTRKMIWKVIDKLRDENDVTIFLTTHYMEEASDSDYIVVIDEGKVLAEGTPLELKNKYTGDYVTLYGIKEEEVKLLKKPYKKIKDAYRVFIEDTSEATSLIMKHPKIFQDYEIIKGKLDDVFINLTNKEIKEGGDYSEDINGTSEA